MLDVVFPVPVFVEAFLSASVVFGANKPAEVVADVPLAAELVPVWVGLLPKRLPVVGAAAAFAGGLFADVVLEVFVNPPKRFPVVVVDAAPDDAGVVVVVEPKRPPDAGAPELAVPVELVVPVFVEG